MDDTATGKRRLDLRTVFRAIDIPALVLDAEGDVLVWNEPLEELLDVDRAEVEAADNMGEAIYEERELILAEKVLAHPQNADEVYDIEVADSEYALLRVDGYPTYEDTSTATRGSGEDIWFLATPLYDGDTLVGVIEFVQHRTDSERRRREMERLLDEFHGTLSAFQEGDYTARAEYDFADTVVQEEDRELLDQVNDLAQMREALREQVRETEQAKRQLERRNRQLTQKNQRLDQFASLVSHDLRNPLNVAKGYLDLAEETSDPEHFESVREAHDRMETMIDEMLTMARAGQAIETTEECLLADAAVEAWEIVQSADAELECRVGQATVDADRTRLLHIFENLFRNAVDHNSPPLVVRVGTLDGGDGFYVEDTGQGIPDDERDEVFDYGYTTSDSGSGYGLAIVGDIVDAHGWTITVSESPAGGARFEIVV